MCMYTNEKSSRSTLTTIAEPLIWFDQIWRLTELN